MSEVADTTPEEKRRVWHERYADTHNQKRRDKYKNDPEYRASVKADYRARYRAKAKGEPKDCRTNYDDLDVIGEYRECSINGEPVNELCFVMSEVAEALMYSVSGLRKMFGNGIFPNPVVTAKVENNSFGRRMTTNQYVYVEAELRSIMEVLGDHQTKYSYLSATRNPGTIQAIVDALDSVRSEYGIETPVD